MQRPLPERRDLLIETLAAGIEAIADALERSPLLKPREVRRVLRGNALTPFLRVGMP